MKKFSRIASLILAVVLFAGCEDISQLPLKDKNGEPVEYPTEETTQPYTEYTAQVPEITPAEVSMTVEAEDCDLNGSLYTETKRKGFAGKGYVTGFFGGSADYLVIPVDIPTSQHYDITVCVASDVPVSNSVLINDENIGDFEIDGKSKKFTRVTFYGVFMNRGENRIQIDKGSAEFDVDYVEIVNDEEIYQDAPEIVSTPVSEKSSVEARGLLRYIKQNYGECTLTGQYASSSRNYEIDEIHEKTGQYPAIRFGDIGGYAEGKPPLESEIQAAKDWAKRGGIVGMMWYWRSPGKESSIYANDTSFDLSKAVTSEKIAELGISELQELCRDGVISKECLALIEDIDDVSEGLLELADEGIPVLWRPLHEAGGGWYWWGAKGAEPYKWLYNLMFERMTMYHKLDNLIWIWNGQDQDYLVDENRYDIASMDIYLNAGSKFGSRSEQFQWLKKITEGKKILALSECSSVPGIDEMLRDKSVWAFFGLWFGEYMSGNDSSPDKGYTSDSELYRIYNAENTITLDKYAGVYGY